jgi:hypothetical protein
MCRNLALLFLLMVPSFGFATQVQGRITDENGDALAFVTIHEKYTTNGTTSNADGYYNLTLLQDTATVVFQYVGYQTIEKRLADSNLGRLDIQMTPDLLTLEAVVIEAGAEDPAYEIIRQAIANRKKHLQEIQDYRCQVYIKGMQRLDNVPGKILGIPVTVDTGIVYLSESVSELSFQHPDRVKERVISSKVSGDNRAFSFNQASDMLINFYQNHIYAEGLSERSFVSPVAENAFLFYDYRLLGTTVEDGRSINKIKVIPKRNHDPSFAGEIYVIENSWRIHSLDLLLTKQHQIEFVDSLRVKQVLAPVRDTEAEVWTVLTQQFDFQLNAFGFTGYGYFVGVYKNYVVNQGFVRKYFDNEIVRVEPKSNQKDSSYWNAIRPIPLTIEEIQDYQIKDSLQVVKESRAYLDSVDQKSNRITLVNMLFTGKTIRNSFRESSWNFPPLIRLLQYNTVEGLVTYFRPSYTRRFEDQRFYRIAPEFRYGFSNERFNARLNARYFYNPHKFASVRLSAGRFVEQLNEQSPLQPIDNTIYTLFLEKNYLKIYEKLHVTVSHQQELVNGLYMDTKLEWAQRNPLQNTTDFSFRDKTEREFTPNFPINQELDDTAFEKHQAFLFDFQIRWQPGQEYIRRPYRKFVTKTKYPSLSLSWRGAIPDILGSDLNYQMISAAVNHGFKTGLLGSGQFIVEVGGFLNRDSLSFVDFKHFNGNRTVFGHFEIGNYQLLDYYLLSTTEPYLQAHYEHHFNGFIFNKIPLLRKARIQMVTGLNYLNTDIGDDYWELGVGIEHIFKILRIDYYNSWQSGKHQRNGIRFGIGF